MGSAPVSSGEGPSDRSRYQPAAARRLHWTAEKVAKAAVVGVDAAGVVVAMVRVVTARRRVTVMAMSVLMPVPMTVYPSEDDRTQHIDQQPDHGDPDGLAVLDRLRLEQPLHRGHRHQGGHPQQEQRTGKAAQHFDFPGAKGKPLVVAQTARGDIRQDADPDGRCVRTHVPAIGQQGHGAQPRASRDFEHHRHQRDPQHRPGAAFGACVRTVEVVCVMPGGLEGVHALSESVGRAVRLPEV